MSIKKSFVDNWKTMVAPLVITTALIGVAGCEQWDPEVVSYNISAAADNFEINRRIVLYNTYTDTYILEIDGRCSLKPDSQIPDEIAIICKTGPNEYKKHCLGKSSNVTYFMEQIDPADANPYHYAVIFKPQVVVPDVILKGSAEDLKRTVLPRPGVLQSPSTR